MRISTPPHHPLRTQCSYPNSQHDETLGGGAVLGAITGIRIFQNSSFRPEKMHPRTKPGSRFHHSTKPPYFFFLEVAFAFVLAAGFLGLAGLLAFLTAGALADLLTLAAAGGFAAATGFPSTTGFPGTAGFAAGADFTGVGAAGAGTTFPFPFAPRL